MSSVELTESAEFRKIRNLYTNFGNPDLPFDYSNINVEHSYVQNVLQPFLNSLKKHQPLILDLGCGRGEYSDAMERLGAKTVRLDISNNGLINQRQNKVSALVFRLPFANYTFDGIHFKDVYTHIHPNLRDMLFSEIARVLKPKASLMLVSVEHHVKPWHEVQYDTQYDILVNILRNSSLFVNCKNIWKPENPQKDWYRKNPNGTPRYVLDIRKFSYFLNESSS